MSASGRAQIMYLPHGGGPLPLLGDPSHAALSGFLTSLGKSLTRTEAILVISAHWEHKCVAVTSAENPPLIFDYYGFPEESYQLRYPAPGAPALASTIHTLLSTAGIPSTLDDQRGFDHGLFVPLTLLQPSASIPCLQLSLLDSLDAQQHLALGQALRPLCDRNVLIIGSGLSFHNMRAFGSQQGEVENRQFEAWLEDTCCSTRLTEPQRMKSLQNWHAAPGAAFCHPRPEHLLPLHVCAGIAGCPAERIFFDQVMGKWASGYRWR